jgi:hypothetical protein
MSPKFVENCTELLNSIKACDGDQARLAHRLSRAINKLEEIHALAGFAAAALSRCRESWPNIFLV